MAPSPRKALPAGAEGLFVESIEEERRSPNHRMLLLSNGLGVRLDRAEVEACRCRAGTPWSPALVASIEARRAATRLRERAFSRLARREHSRADLARRLIGEGFADAAVAETLDELEADGWLDERRFIERRLDEWLRRPAHGRAWLLARLERDGIDRGDAEQALGTLYPPEAEQAAARRVARSLAADPRATPRRIAAGLARRGFDEETLRAVEPCRELFESD